MTKPRYSPSCAAGSKVEGLSQSFVREGETGYVWIVNFNNGNVNNNNRNNSGLARFVRGGAAGPSECLSGVSVRGLYSAYQAAKRGKKASSNRIQFDTSFGDELLGLERKIASGTWHPSPCACFIATKPKAREIHAPAFRDRVVHHWAIPQLDQLFEPTFAYESFSNRAGKGTHAAVDLLRKQVRQVQSGQGKGYYLQLDIKHFFGSIDRRRLWKMLKRVMEREQLSPALQFVVHALLRRSPTHYGVTHHSNASERARIPEHKRLENAPAGRGLAIGNLSSQFFANVYLNALDQFVKHVLKVPRYVRFVDDFVLVHQDREQLERWRVQIETFLHEELGLELKADQKLRPLTTGIDFLGYVVFPTHTRVRRRVISHARERFSAWEAQHVGRGRIRATPAQYRQIQASAASYLQGHLQHANSHQLAAQLHQQFPWLVTATMSRKFHHRLEGRYVNTYFSGADCK